MDIPADTLLRTYSSAALQQMARFRGITKLTKKEKLVSALAGIIYDPETIHGAVEGLAPVERRLLDLLVLSGGQAPTAFIRQQLEHEGQIDASPKPDPSSHYFYSSYERNATGSLSNRASRKFEDVVARLGATGLVFSTEPTGSYGSMIEINAPGRRLFIPDAILKHLPVTELPVETTSAPETVMEGDPALLLRDFYLLLSFAAREAIPLTTRGLIPKRTLARVEGSLRQSEWSKDVRSEDDLSWLPFLRALAEESHLLFDSAGDLRLDERAEAFLGLPASERQARLFEAWRETTRWNELFRIPDIDVKGKGLSVRAAPQGIVDARQRVLAELADLPVNEWVHPGQFVERLRLRAYEFLLPRRAASDSYYYYRYYGTSSLPNPYPGPNNLGMSFDIAKEASGWDLVEANFIRAILAEPLNWLGVVDLGETDGAVTAFRITDDGARLLRGEAPAARPSLPQVVVQPNFQIFVMEPTGEEVLFRLDQMADRLRADQAIEYELTRDSVYRAQRAGLDAQAIVEFLESVSTVGLPQNVRRTVEEWGAQTERVTVRRRTPLLHAVDEKTLDDLFADPELAHLLGRRVAPTVALVSAANLQPLLDHLIRRNLLPALTEGPDDRPTPLLAGGADGVLAIRQQLPSIYDLRTLRAFAEDVDGTVRLSQESLRRAAKSGLSADDILATMERLHAGPLPPEIMALVRRWAKDWGEGALIEATVLQVETPEMLSDLLADPEVRPSLLPVPGAPTIAIVRPTAVERVRALLNDRGMALVDHLLG